MKKIITITSLFLLVIALLLAGTTFYLSHYVDPNKYKGRLSQYVFAKTGQVLVINGNMEWSVFPWIGLRAKKLVYYNPHQFTPKIFVSAKEMDIKVKLVPLFTKKIEIGNITLNNAIINITKNKQGDFNWEALTKKDKKIEIQKETLSSTTLSNITVESLKIKDSKINWLDQLNHNQITITALNVTSNHIQFGKSFPLLLQLAVMKEKNKGLSLQLNTDITLPTRATRYQLSNLALEGHYHTEKTKLNFKLAGNLAGDLPQKAWNGQFNFHLNNIAGKLELKDNPNKPSHIMGTFSTDYFNAAEFLQDLDNPIAFKNEAALKSVYLISKVDIADGLIAFNQLHAIIDQIDIYGHLTYALKDNALFFNLTTNAINLDQYQLKSGNTNLSDASHQTQIKKADTHSSTFKTNGTLRITKLTSNKLQLTNLSAKLASSHDVWRISPLQATFYKGLINGNITLDKSNPNQTLIAIKQTIDHLDMKELLHQFSDSDKLCGSTYLTTDLVSTMNRKQSFLAGLNGKIKLVLSEGSIKGVDVIYQLSKAHAFLKHLPSPSISNTKKTAFSGLLADASVTNGILATDNLSLTSDYLKVNGKGTTNLHTKEIHYRLNALAQPKLANENHQIGQEITLYQVPIKITGSLAKPSVNLDFVELAKLFLVKEIQKPISQHLDQTIQSVKANLKEQVQNKLHHYSGTDILHSLIPKLKSTHSPTN